MIQYGRAFMRDAWDVPPAPLSVPRAIASIFRMRIAMKMEKE
jgi:hypothetical protein